MNFVMPCLLYFCGVWTLLGVFIFYDRMRHSLAKEQGRTLPVIEPCWSVFKAMFWPIWIIAEVFYFLIRSVVYVVDNVYIYLVSSR